jgi:hypothetical protein
MFICLYVFTCARLFSSLSLSLSLYLSLCGRGADLDHVDYDKRSAAHVAAMNGNVSCLALLVEAGARSPTRARPCDGAFTSLTLFICFSSSFMCARVGIDLSLVDRFGHSALDDARTHKHTAAVTLLEGLSIAGGAAAKAAPTSAPAPKPNRWLLSLRTQPTQTAVRLRHGPRHSLIVCAVRRAGLTKRSARL